MPCICYLKLWALFVSRTSLTLMSIISLLHLTFELSMATEECMEHMQALTSSVCAAWPQKSYCIDNKAYHLLLWCLISLLLNLGVRMRGGVYIIIMVTGDSCIADTKTQLLLNVMFIISLLCFDMCVQCVWRGLAVWRLPGPSHVQLYHRVLQLSAEQHPCLYQFWICGRVRNLCRGWVCHVMSLLRLAVYGNRKKEKKEVHSSQWLGICFPVIILPVYNDAL